MKKLIGIAAFLVLAVAVWVAATNVIDKKAAKIGDTTAAIAIEKNGLQVGDKAPDFKLKNVDGKMVSLKDYTNVKGYIVIFTCNTCPWAQGYEDRIIELNEKFASKGYPVIAIQPNDPAIQPGDSFEKMQERAKNKSYKFPYLLDDGQEVYPVYGASHTPEVYLLDKNLMLQYTGAIDNNPRQEDNIKTVNYVAEAIAALDAGKKPEPSLTKAIGCGIKARRAN